MKVAIYLRVSRDDLNLDNQRLPLIKKAEMEGWDYEVFEEKESTRKTRPIQNMLYHKALRKEVDAIVVYKFDRWARDVVELITHMNDFKVKGVAFISYCESIDTSTSHGRAFFGFMAVMAEFERDLIRERTMAGLDTATARGKIKGRHPVNCGCGKNGHNGNIKPIRDKHNKFIGWDKNLQQKPTPPVKPPINNEGKN